MKQTSAPKQVLIKKKPLMKKVFLNKAIGKSVSLQTPQNDISFIHPTNLKETTSTVYKLVSLPSSLYNTGVTVVNCYILVSHPLQEVDFDWLIKASNSSCAFIFQKETPDDHNSLFFFLELNCTFTSLKC